MYNKKVLSQALANLQKRKAELSQPKDIIVDPMGQYNHPGEVTRIPSNDITMKDVPYPVMAYPNIGEPQMMYPEQNYNFPDADYVDEVPMAKYGGLVTGLRNTSGNLLMNNKGKRIMAESGSLSATNKLMLGNPLVTKRKNAVFVPGREFQEGGENQVIEAELTDEEIEEYKRGGYIIEMLPKAQEGKQSLFSPELKEKMETHKNQTNNLTRFVQNNPLPTQKVPANRQEAEEMIRKGEIKPETSEEITQRRLKSKDTWQENVIELLDPTGISSYDDAERAYYEWKDSKSSYPDFGQVMDMFGAVPLLGKFGKLKYLKDAPKLAYGLIPWQKMLNAMDGAQDIIEDNLLQQQGGEIELELTPEEIQYYKQLGYTVEEI
jgi:hypothetical protein